MKKIEVRPYDAARYLDDEDAMRGYLALCLEDDDINVFFTALADVARARGMAQLAADTGLSRESLYKTFGRGKKPQFETVWKVARALKAPLSIGADVKAAKKRNRATA